MRFSTFHKPRAVKRSTLRLYRLVPITFIGSFGSGSASPDRPSPRELMSSRFLHPRQLSPVRCFGRLRLVHLPGRPSSPACRYAGLRWARSALPARSLARFPLSRLQPFFFFLHTRPSSKQHPSLALLFLLPTFLSFAAHSHSRDGQQPLRLPRGFYPRIAFHAEYSEHPLHGLLTLWTLSKALGQGV